jgi:hypothetical protein
MQTELNKIIKKRRNIDTNSKYTYICESQKQQMV